MTAISLYLRSLRGASGLTKEQAAVHAGISSKTLERWEAGKNEPIVSNLKRLVRALQGSVNDAIYLLVHDEIDPIKGKEAAEAWLKLSKEERERVDSIFTATSFDELDVLLKDLQAEIQGDKTRVGLLRLLIDSWRGDAQ